MASVAGDCHPKLHVKIVAQDSLDKKVGETPSQWKKARHAFMHL
jgi:hypothetical protein